MHLPSHIYADADYLFLPLVTHLNIHFQGIGLGQYFLIDLKMSLISKFIVNVMTRIDCNSVDKNLLRHGMYCCMIFLYFAYTSIPIVAIDINYFNSKKMAGAHENP